MIYCLGGGNVDNCILYKTLKQRFIWLVAENGITKGDRLFKYPSTYQVARFCDITKKKAAYYMSEVKRSIRRPRYTQVTIDKTEK